MITSQIQQPKKEPLKDLEIQTFFEKKGDKLLRNFESAFNDGIKSYQRDLEKLRFKIFPDTQNLKQQHNAAIYQQSFGGRGEKLEDYLDDIATKKKQGKRGKRIKWNLSGESDFGLKVRHYIPSQVNVKSDISNQYPLTNLCAFAELKEQITYKEELMRPSNNQPTEKVINDLKKYELIYLCKYLQMRVSSDIMTLRVLSQILKKSPNVLLKYWLKASKPDSKPKMSSSLYAFNNAQYYCSLCHKYVCNAHYEETQDENELNKDPDHEFSPFSSKYIVARTKQQYHSRGVVSKGKRDISLIEEKKLNQTANGYKCPDKFKKQCFKFDGIIDEGTENFRRGVQLKHHEKMFIEDYAIKYDIQNPCMIRLMFNSKITCYQIGVLITQQKDGEKIGSYPGILIEKEKEETQKLKDIGVSSALGQNKKKVDPDSQKNYKGYVQCYHPFKSCVECACVERGYCDIWCGCSMECPIKVKGCSCKAGRCTERSKCECIAQNRECHPLTCRGCCCNVDMVVAKKTKSGRTYCPNTALMYKMKTKLWLGQSGICPGMGIFAGQNFEQDDFIGEYTGEMIDDVENEVRGALYNDVGCSYMFNHSEEHTLDSYFYGNKMRFINHGIDGEDNSLPKYRFSQGLLHIALYAKKRIYKGEEILFNYGESYKLDWLIEYNDKAKKRRNEENQKRKAKNKQKKIDLFHK